MKEFPPENPKMYEASISEARGADRKRARKKEEKWEAKERIFAQRKGERGLEQKGTDRLSFANWLHLYQVQTALRFFESKKSIDAILIS